MSNETIPQHNLELETTDSTPFLLTSPTEEGIDKQDILINPEGTGTATGTGRYVATLSAYKYIYAAGVLATTGGVLFGYDLGIISSAILQLRQEFCFGIVKSEVVVSSLVAGAVVGSLTGGILVDLLGRKFSIILDSILFSVGAVVLVASENLWMLIIGRLVTGYAVSLCATAECVYVSEIAPASKRGMLVSLNEVGICLGILLAYFIGFLFVDVPEGWRYMFALSIIIAVIQGIGTLFLPRTPRFLLLKGKDALALSTLQKIRGRDTDVGSEFNEMRAAILEESQYHWWDLFRLKGCMLYRMLIGCMVVLFQQLSGQNSLLYYTPTLLKVLGFSSDQTATLATLGVGAVKFVSTIFTLFFIDRIGRRPLLLIGISLLAISMLLLGSLSIAYIDPHLVLANSSTHLSGCENNSLLTQSEYTFPVNLTLSLYEQTSLTVTKWFSLILLMLYVGAYGLSFGSIGWLLLTELFPPSIRGQAVSLSSTVNWVMNLLISVSLLSVYHLLLGYMYILYGAFCVLALIFVFFTVPETKGKSLERISQEFKKKKCICIS